MSELPISDLALVKMAESKDAGRPVREPGVFYIYDLAVTDCTLDTVLGIILGKGEPGDDPDDGELQSLRIFDAGNTLQDWWRDRLRAAGYKVIAEEFRARWSPPGREWVAHGRGDLMVQDPGYGEIRVREVKTIKSTHYVRDRPKDEHYRQCQYYLNILGFTGGSVDYIDKLNFATGDGPVVITHEFDRHPSIMGELLNRGDMLYGWLKPLWDLSAELHPITAVDIVNLLSSGEIKLPEPSPCWKCNGKNRDGRIYCKNFELCKQIAAVQAGRRNLNNFTEAPQ